MVAGCQSRFSFLAADPLSAERSCSPLKDKKSRLGFFCEASGRHSRRRRFRSMFAPGSRACGYKTASGLAKWPNRDPIGEKGGLDLYGFVANDPISLADSLGLEWLFYHRDSAKPRTTVMCCNGDTVDNLAKQIKLDPADFDHWLLAIDGQRPKTSSEKINGTRRFTIPNVALMTQGNSAAQHGYDIAAALFKRKELLKKHYQDLGYHVVDNVTTSEEGQQLSEVTQALQDPGSGAWNVYVWAHYGHGGGGGDLSFARNLDQLDFVRATPSQFTPHHKLAEVVLFSCEAGVKNKEWLNLVAPGGTLYSSVPLIFPLVGDLASIVGGWKGPYDPLTPNIK